MSYLKAIILGLVQGLTEFLPVSSSGHLTMLQYFFDIESDSVLMFTILLHVGTLVSVFIMYWRDIVALIIELFATIADLVRGRGLHLDEKPVRKFGVMIIVASIPTGIIGVLFNDFFEKFYQTLLPTGIGLLVTGFLLWYAESRKRGDKEIEEMRFRDALVIGTLQGVAITPGISRSGSTLFGGLVSNLDRDFAVKFAFILSIPSILGSLIFESSSGAFDSLNSTNIGPVLAGTAVAVVSGIFAIKVMINVVRKHSLKIFSVYVWIVGVILILSSIF